GLCFMRVPAPAPSVGAQMHGAPHFVECLARDLARLVGALGDDAAHQLRVVLELLGAPAHAADLLHDPVDQRLLAVQATDAGAAVSNACGSGRIVTPVPSRNPSSRSRSATVMRLLLCTSAWARCSASRSPLSWNLRRSCR